MMKKETKKILEKYGIELPKDLTFYKNPAIDILFGSMDSSVPSKQVGFKPINAWFTDEDGKEQILHDFYQRKPSSKSVKEFENLIHGMIDNSPYLSKQKISKPAQVEVIIHITLLKSQVDKIDVDNIAKTVLDSIKGYLIDDDSQVVRLVCEKTVHVMNKPSFLIAITELKPDRPGLLGGYYFYTTTNPLK